MRAFLLYLFFVSILCACNNPGEREKQSSDSTVMSMDSMSFSMDTLSFNDSVEQLYACHTVPPIIPKNNKNLDTATFYKIQLRDFVSCLKFDIDTISHLTQSEKIERNKVSDKLYEVISKLNLDINALTIKTYKPLQKSLEELNQNLKEKTNRLDEFEERLTAIGKGLEFITNVATIIGTGSAAEGVSSIKAQ